MPVNRLRGAIGELTFYSSELNEASLAHAICTLGDGGAAADTPPSPLLAVTFDKHGPVVADAGAVAEPVLPSETSERPLMREMSKLGGRETKKRRSSGKSTKAPGHEPIPTHLPDPATAPWPLDWLPARPRERVSAEVRNASDALARQRLVHVRGAFARAWRSYRRYAWGADEIRPISNRTHEWLHLGTRAPTAPRRTPATCRPRPPQKDESRLSQARRWSTVSITCGSSACEKNSPRRLRGWRTSSSLMRRGAASPSSRRSSASSVGYSQRMSSRVIRSACSPRDDAPPSLLPPPTHVGAARSRLAVQNPPSLVCRSSSRAPRSSPTR